MNFQALRSESAILHVFPFSSDKKRGGVAGQRVISYAVSSEIYSEFFRVFVWFGIVSEYNI